MANSPPSDVMANGALPTAGGEKRRRVTALYINQVERVNLALRDRPAKPTRNGQ